MAVNIQHFAVITSEEQCSKFSFIIARCSQKELPYTFREREGSFNPHTQYGAIKLKQFSLVGETSPEDTELRFTSLKFYKPMSSTLTMVDYIFVVVYNHELFLEVHACVVYITFASFQAACTVFSTSGRSIMATLRISRTNYWYLRIM